MPLSGDTSSCLEMCFEEGYLNLDGILSGTRSYAPEKLVIGRREFEDVTFAMGKPKESIVYFESDHSWNLEIEEFIECGEWKRRNQRRNIARRL